MFDPDEIEPSLDLPGPAGRPSSLRRREFDAERIDLFPTVAWMCDLGFLADVRDHLVADAWELLSDPVPGQPGLQTPGNLQLREEPWWQRCFEAITSFTDAIACDLRPPWQERSIFSWALGYRSSNDYLTFVGDTRDAEDKMLQGAMGFGHTHTAATFTSVLYLQVPEEMTETGATVLRNPNYALHHRLGGPLEHRFQPRPLKLLVFPGYVEHHPELAVLPEPWSTPRLIVSTDVCYY